MTYELSFATQAVFRGSGGVADIGEGSQSTLDSRIQTGLSGVGDKGANWVASLASRLSVELSEGSAELGGSLASLTITQPLLKGASKRAYRERLTLAERRLLSDARSLEQFRQGFFLAWLPEATLLEEREKEGLLHPLPNFRLLFQDSSDFCRMPREFATRRLTYQIEGQSRPIGGSLRGWENRQSLTG